MDKVNSGIKIHLLLLDRGCLDQFARGAGRKASPACLCALICQPTAVYMGRPQGCRLFEITGRANLLVKARGGGFNEIAEQSDLLLESWVPLILLVGLD
jgi:hypothetical protein